MTHVGWKGKQFSTFNVVGTSDIKMSKKVQIVFTIVQLFKKGMYSLTDSSAVGFFLSYLTGVIKLVHLFDQLNICMPLK